MENADVIIVARGPVSEIEEEFLEERISLGSYRLVEQLGSGGWVRCG